MLRGVCAGLDAEVDVVARGGAVVRGLSESIQHNAVWIGRRNIKVGDYRFIVVHVGTNDVADGRSVDAVSDDLKELLETVRRLNRDAVLLVSAVLYRPKDDLRTYQRVNAYNVAFKRVCDPFRSVLFLGTQTLFKSGSLLLTQLYDVHGLHLNRDGLDRVGKYLRARLTRGTLLRDFELAKRPIPGILR
jgi:hypothetical protein